MAFDYCYPGTNVLINKFGYTDFDKLQFAEREYTAIRQLWLEKYPIEGNFDLKHMQAIHKYIFQDVYEWAGKLRTVNISKANTMFANPLYITTEADRIFKELVKDNFLKGLNVEEFSSKLAYYSGEINVLHPFREGNGRTTREYIRCLAQNAGYIIDYKRINNETLFKAYVDSVYDCNGLNKVYKSAILSYMEDTKKLEVGVHSSSVEHDKVIVNVIGIGEVDKQGKYCIEIKFHDNDNFNKCVALFRGIENSPEGINAVTFISNGRRLDGINCKGKDLVNVLVMLLDQELNVEFNNSKYLKEEFKLEYDKCKGVLSALKHDISNINKESQRLESADIALKEYDKFSTYLDRNTGLLKNVARSFNQEQKEIFQSSLNKANNAKDKAANNGVKDRKDLAAQKEIFSKQYSRIPEINKNIKTINGRIGLLSKALQAIAKASFKDLDKNVPMPSGKQKLKYQSLDLENEM